MANNRSVQAEVELFSDRQAQCRAFASGVVALLNELPPTTSFSPEHATLVVLLQRAAGWLHSVGKLEAVFDYQAHSAACRSLLEIAVDVALISDEPALHERMRAFEQSQLFKAASKYRDFVRRTNMRNPDESLLQHADTNEQFIAALRLQHWPDPNRPGRGVHPKTWFGPALPQVAAEADRRVGTAYERFYFEHYDRLCWGTHGSTLMLVRNTPQSLPGIAAMALVGSQQLMMELTQRVLSVLGHDEDAIGDQLAARQMYVSLQRQIDEFSRIAALGESGSS